MGRRSHTRSLGLWMNGAFVGTWSLGAHGPDILQYDLAWTQSEQGRPLSLSLPFMPGNIAHRGQHGAGLVREPAARQQGHPRAHGARYRADSTDAFDLLAEAGRDCAGALQILPDRTSGTASSGVARWRQSR
jgi:serine/threonine-protein kinase HipA